MTDRAPNIVGIKLTDASGSVLTLSMAEGSDEVTLYGSEDGVVIRLSDLFDALDTINQISAGGR